MVIFWNNHKGMIIAWNGPFKIILKKRKNSCGLRLRPPCLHERSEGCHITIWQWMMFQGAVKSFFLTSGRLTVCGINANQQFILQKLKDKTKLKLSNNCNDYVCFPFKQKRLFDSIQLILVKQYMSRILFLFLYHSIYSHLAIAHYLLSTQSYKITRFHSKS